MSPRSSWLVLCLLACLWPLTAAAGDLVVLEDQPTSLVYPPFWHTPFGIHRGTPQLLAMFVGDRARFSDPQGLGCNRLFALLDRPGDNPEFQLTVVGANSGQANLIFDPDLTRLEVVGAEGDSQGALRRPWGVAVANDGTTYVTDLGAHTVFRWMQHAGRLLPAGTLPPPAGGWGTPWGVALDSQGRIYVSDNQRNLICVYSPEGLLQRTIGPKLGPGVELENPRALAVVDEAEPWSFYHDNYLFISDQGGRRLLRCNLRGAFQLSMDLGGLPTAGPGASGNWMALDYYENLWVTDTARHQVLKFNRHLSWLDSYGQAGEGDGKFRAPTGIAIYRHFGQVFIAESQGAHYFWIGADARDLQAERLNPRGLRRLAFTLTEPAWVTVTVTRSPEAPEETLCSQQWFDSGVQTLFWNPPDGSAVDKDPRFVLTAEATYSSARYFAKRLVFPSPSPASP